MTETLYCWLEHEPIGRFARDATGTISFSYDGPGERIISLSLPREGAVRKSAAANFLDALTPERPAAREALKTYSGAKSSSTWHLLEAAGSDVAGGLVLLPIDSLPTHATCTPILIQSDQIARRVIEVRKVPSSAFISDVAPVRYSLAGAQGKFAMGHIDGEWFWPDAAHPSTHIFKPSAEIHPGLDELEVETLRLAGLAGLDVPHAEVMEFVGQPTFAIERFDRLLEADGFTSRLHAEDLTQVLGEPTKRKYDVGVAAITRALREHTGDNELGYAFFRQLIFNVTIGNADAHAKNYTVLHGIDAHGSPKVRMSPLYDALPLGLVPGGYSMELSMKIGHARHFNAVTPYIWRAAARRSGLDEHRVTELVREIASGVLEHLDATIGTTRLAQRSPDHYDAIRRSAERNAT